jgi:DNA-binding transcriptional LysR family regulator
MIVITIMNNIDHLSLDGRMLYQDRSVCFYDAGHRTAPKEYKDFANANYISLTFLQGQAVHNEFRRFDLDSRVTVRVAYFSGIGTFLKGTDLLAIAPGLLSRTVLQNYATAALPFELNTLTMYMIWHQKDHQHPEHAWFRKQIVEVCQQLS